MDKKQISSFKKELKVNSRNLMITNLFSSYVKRDDGKIIYSEKKNFESIDEDLQELYIKNFKKILTGSIDDKIFDLNFKIKPEESIGTQNLLIDIMNEEFTNEEIINSFVSKVYKNCIYDTDFMINIIKGEYWSKSKVKEIEEDSKPIDFIICSINKITPPKKTLKFDYESKSLKQNSPLDVVVDLNSPIQGFLFPSMEEYGEDVNKLLYYNGKNKVLDETFVKEVLECEVKATIKEEKDNFSNIIKFITEDGIKPNTLQNIYEFMNEKQEDDENAIITIRDIVPFISSESKLNDKEIQNICEKILGSPNYEFKVNNILPDFNAQSIKLENKDMRISIAPKDLHLLTQKINENGERYLVIKLMEKSYIDDIEIKDENK